MVKKSWSSYPLPSSKLRILIFWLMGVYKGHLGGLDKFFKIRDRHHRIRGGGGGGCCIPDFNWSIHIGVATIFSFFYLG